MNYDRIHVGDLVSWCDISINRRKRQGLVLKKWIKNISDKFEKRKIAMLRVVDFYDNQIINIYAINAKIESKRTT